MSFTWFCDICRGRIGGKRFRLEEQVGPFANASSIAALDICEDCRSWLLQRRVMEGRVDESVV
jgi:hypothetical protein